MNKPLAVLTDPAEIAEKLANEDVLCLVLREDLDPRVVYQLSTRFTLLYTHYEDKPRMVAGLGLYADSDTQGDESIENAIDAQWGERTYDDPEESLIFDERIDDPLCYLLREDLNSQQIDFLKSVYEVIQITHQHTSRQAIACVIYNQDQQPILEPQILAQTQIMVVEKDGS